MRKKPASINDQLARIASAAPTSIAQRDDANTLPRDSVVTDPVARDNVTTREEPAGPEGYKRRVRYEKPHASIYAHPKVFKALREIAVAQDCKPHDLYLEGLRLVLRAHGRDFDTLNRGE